MNRLIIILSLIICQLGMAQEQQESQTADSDKSAEAIEGLYEQEKSQENKIESQPEETVKSEPEEKRELPDVKKLSNLNQLELFDDVATIQKRFLPKTKRFEAFIGAATTINDAFFAQNGLNGRLGYYFSERWGVEGNLGWMSSSDKAVTTALQEIAVNTGGQVATELYYTLDIKWIPIYGKYAYFNQKIIPFDLYFIAGLGKSNVFTKNASNVVVKDSPLTFQFGTGQVFSITKSMAFRWEIGWNFMNTNNPISGQTDLQNNMFLQLGMSFFFPEAKYR